MAELRERPLHIIWTWLDWWHVDHYTIKVINRVWSPFIGVTLSTLSYFAGHSISIFGSSGAIIQANGLIPVLAGFYVASLAAVATFQREGLDELMGGIAPTLAVTKNRKPESLTRRRFLSILFGYLAGASISIYIAGSLAVVLAPAMKKVGLSVEHFELLRAMVLAIYFSAFANLILVSLVGLYYLIERLHQTPVREGFEDAEGHGDDGGDTNGGSGAG